MSDPSSPPPLRLSEWTSPPANPPEPGSSAIPEHPPPPPRPAPLPIGEMARARPERPAFKSAPGEDVRKDDAPPAPATTPPQTKFKPSPTVFQGFDLLRLPLGILRRWWLWLPLAAIGAVLGFLGGMKAFSVSATVSVRLMSRSPQTFAVSTSSYVPSRVQGATLLGALGSPQVAREVAEKMGGDLTAREIQSMITIEEIRKTDFVDIVVTTPFDVKKTAEIATLWAREALAFTSKLQAEESGEMKRYLEEQLARTDRELEAVNQKIVAMREESGVVDIEKEMDAYLKNISDIDLKNQTALIDLDGVNFQLEALRKEIRKHSPSFEELKTEEAKLQEMAEYYTDQNPIYLEALSRVEALREKVRNEVDSPDVPLSDFTGTYVGNALYLQILDLESRKENLLLQTKEYAKLLAESREKLKDLPGKAMIAGPLMENSQALRAARDVLIKRIQEVAVFQEVAPGYYRLFKTPTAKDVAVSSRKGKLVFAGIAGGFFFFLIGAVGAAGLEFLDPTVRTPAEAESAMECKSLAHITTASKKQLFAQSLRPQDVWAAVIGGLAASRARVFWMPVSAGGAERFWALLLEAGESMSLKILVVHAGGVPASALDRLPRIALSDLSTPPVTGRQFLLELPADATADDVRSTITKIRSAHDAFQEIWIEVGGLVREPVAAFSREYPDTIMLCALNVSDRDFWHTQRTLLASKKSLRGVVAIDR